MAAPKLRFKEFDRDWTTQSLGNVTDITKLAGYEFTKHINYQDSGEIIALRGLNVKGNNLVLEDVKYIDNSDLSMLSRSKLYIDDLLFTYVGTIGEVALIPENDKFYLAPNVCRIRRVNKNILSKYLMFLFSNENFKKNQIDKYTTKSSQPALSMENIRKFEIVFPSVEEQTKIASFLSAVDEKISQLTQKHELLSQYKQGMMQKLFSQQIRFKADDGSEFGEWGNLKIFDLAKDKTLNNGVFNDQNKVGKGYKLINVLDMYINRDIDESRLKLLDLSKKEFEKNKVYYGDIFFTRSSLVKEGIAFSNVYLGNSNDVTYDGHLIKLTPDLDRVSPIFLNYVLKTNAVRKQLIKGGKTATMTTIGQQEVGNTMVPLPCLEEQTKIANFLSAIDQKIEVVAQQIEQAKTWKKGLLQQMFV